MVMMFRMLPGCLRAACMAIGPWRPGNALNAVPQHNNSTPTGS